MGPPYGVVGPLCKQGNTEILTHDFTHRTHMEFFDRQYYPTNLTDWWLDDWMNKVYGEARTKRIESVEVFHHTQKTRYAVNYSNEALLEPLVHEGGLRIHDWILIYNESLQENIP